MTSRDPENFSALLHIRRTAQQRDTLITGGAFFLSLVALVAFGLLDQLSGKSVYLIAALMTAFGLGYLTTWTKLEVTKALIELLQYLQRTHQG